MKAFTAGWKIVEADPKLRSDSASHQPFVQKWIAHSVSELRHRFDGNHEDVLPLEAAADLFSSVLDAGALPRRYTKSETRPVDGWKTFVRGILWFFYKFAAKARKEEEKDGYKGAKKEG